ncbi:NAD-dependent epimerase/dehydratase family protein [bacterium]|nr:NAD-dependent epimerase/dehydratase family protein [bacterium]
MGRRHGPALRVLVIGSTGAIGSHLCSTLRQNGTEVIGASRHIDAYDKNSLALDLANMADALAAVRKLPKMDAVVISAGITGLRECENDPELSRVVNVGSQVDKQTAGEVGEKPLPHSSLESSNLTAIKSPSSLSTVRKIVEKMV